MKRRMNKKMNRRVLQGLAGIFLSVGAFMLPVSGYAEEAAAAGQAQPAVAQAQEAAAEKNNAAAPVKYVMPQEQVYLDQSQVEAARQQLEADAFYNANPQNAAPAAGTKAVVTKPVAEVKPVTETKQNTAPAAEEKNVTEPANIASAETVKENAVAKKPVQIRHFGVAKEFTTHQATVADVLKDMKINMEGRSSYPPPQTKITDGMVIHVLGRKSFVSHEEVEVPYLTQVVDDPGLAFGTKQVATAGVKGKDIVTYENITRAGYEQKIELDRRHVIAPVNEIVRQGVAQSVLTPEGYVRYKKIIYGEATAYTWGGGATGHTSVGLWPKRGTVAVDPRVIPYYTKLFIPGYGMGIAVDTGGAIIGTRIDLFMDSLSECFQWGRRDVAIYILE